MNIKQAMKVAANMCTCGHYNMPVIGDTNPNNEDYWLFGYVCERCGLMEMSGVMKGMVDRWTEENARDIIRISNKLDKVKG